MITPHTLNTTSWTDDEELPFHENENVTHEPLNRDVSEAREEQDIAEMVQLDEQEIRTQPDATEKNVHAAKDFERGPWMDPRNTEYWRGKRQHTTAIESSQLALANQEQEAGDMEMALLVLADDEPEKYDAAMNSVNADKWKSACQKEIDTLQGYITWKLVPPPPQTNIVGCRWTFRVKRDKLGNANVFKSRLVAQGFSQMAGVNYDETYSYYNKTVVEMHVYPLECFQWVGSMIRLHDIHLSVATWWKSKSM